MLKLHSNLYSLGMLCSFTFLDNVVHMRANSEWISWISSLLFMLPSMEYTFHNSYLRSILQFVLRLFTTSPEYYECNMLKLLNFKESSHLIFKKVFFASRYQYFASLLCLVIDVWCVTQLLAIFQLYHGDVWWSYCMLSNIR